MRPLPLLAVLAVLAATPALADETLQPASPQPDEAALQPGLAVVYAYPPDIKDLHNTQYYIEREGKPGTPLAGLDYYPTDGNALSSERATEVVAGINGFLRFDQAGPHVLEFSNNDGLEVVLGGKRIYRDDTRHPCDTAGAVTVNVPEPGWYELKMMYFQRLETSCLVLNWQVPGASDYDDVPPENFGYLK